VKRNGVRYSICHLLAISFLKFMSSARASWDWGRGQQRDSRGDDQPPTCVSRLIPAFLSSLATRFAASRKSVLATRRNICIVDGGLPLTTSIPSRSGVRRLPESRRQPQTLLLCDVDKMCDRTEGIRFVRKPLEDFCILDTRNERIWIFSCLWPGRWREMPSKLVWRGAEDAQLHDLEPRHQGARGEHFRLELVELVDAF
jgi:hypothetical protein